MATTLPWDAYSSTTEEVEDDVVCEKLEEVVSVGETLQALFDDAEERVQGTKVFNVKVTQALLGRDLAVVGIDDLEPLQIRIG